MSINKCIFCEYAVIHKDYDRATNVVIACRQHQDIFAPVCEYQFINTDSKKEQIDIVPSASPRWIPVTERMPQEFETVLITVKSRDSKTEPWLYFTDVASYDSFNGLGWETFNDWDEGQECYITAWMPLPQPWRGEDDG